MIGRVGRSPCEQLRGLLHSQRRRLEILEAQDPKDEAEITRCKAAIEETQQRLQQNGC